MNTATRVLSGGAVKSSYKSSVQLSASGVCMLILAFAILCTAFCIIYMKDLNRRLFIQYQQQQELQQQYQTDWAKLLLEQSTWSTQARVEQIAQQKLNMVVPGSQNIVTVGD